jgi:hypothetical protein
MDTIVSTSSTHSSSFPMTSSMCQDQFFLHVCHQLLGYMETPEERPCPFVDCVPSSFHTQSSIDDIQNTIYCQGHLGDVGSNDAFASALLRLLKDLGLQSQQATANTWARLRAWVQAWWMMILAAPYAQRQSLPARS